MSHPHLYHHRCATIPGSDSSIEQRQYNILYLLISLHPVLLLIIESDNQMLLPKFHIRPLKVQGGVVTLGIGSYFLMPIWFLDTLYLLNTKEMAI